MVFVWYTKTEKQSNRVEMTIFVLQYNHNVRTIHSVLPCPSLAEVYFQIPEYRWQNGMGGGGSTVPNSGSVLRLNPKPLVLLLKGGVP